MPTLDASPDLSARDLAALAALARALQTHPADLALVLGVDVAEEAQGLIEGGVGLARYLARGSTTDLYLQAGYFLAGEIAKFEAEDLWRLDFLPYAVTRQDKSDLIAACNALVADLEDLFAPAPVRVSRTTADLVLPTTDTTQPIV